MFSNLAKGLLLLAALFVFFSCSRESSEPPWEPQSHLGNKDYHGGLFPVWVTLKEPVTNINSISWKSGYSRIAYRTQAKSGNIIIADTAFLYWDADKLPPPTVDNGAEADTVYSYKDTIFAIVNGLESEPIVIEIKNILPRIASLKVGDISQPGDSLLTIAVHPGNRMDISFSLERSLNKSFHPIVEMPVAEMIGKTGSLKLKSESDSLFVWEWIAPNEIIDKKIILKIKDSGGRGERLYKIHLVLYTECSSVWVASENELVKYSPSGTEVVRIRDNFNSISAIAVNSNDGTLYVADRNTNTFAIYDTYGKELYKNNDLFKFPSGIAIDAEDKYIWVADAKIDTSSEASLRRFIFVGDELKFASVDYDMSALIKGLSFDQFKRDFVWFVNPKSNTIGFVSDKKQPVIMQNDWSRPSMVSIDWTNGIAWVADSSRIVAMDATGKKFAIIKNFGFVSSVSASGGDVWATDNIKGKVYRFPGPFNGYPTDLVKTIIDGTEIPGPGSGFKFISPSSVSAFVEGGACAGSGAWVADREANMVVRLNSTGQKIASGTGLNFPKLCVTLQTTE